MSRDTTLHKSDMFSPQLLLLSSTTVSRFLESRTSCVAICNYNERLVQRGVGLPVEYTHSSYHSHKTNHSSRARWVLYALSRVIRGPEHHTCLILTLAARIRGQFPQQRDRIHL